MAIRYKVVKDRESHPGNIDPQSYPKDTTVLGGKYGIFLLKRKRDAENYLSHAIKKSSRTDPERFEIIKVETIGKGRKLTLCPTQGQLEGTTDMQEVLRLSRKYGYTTTEIGAPVIRNKLSLWLCAPGTMIYPGVKVLT